MIRLEQVLRSPFSVLRSPFSVLRSPFSVLRSPFSVSLAGLFLALLILPFTSCSNGSTEQSGSLEGIWYGGPGTTRDQKFYIVRLTSTDTEFHVEQNRGIGWSPLVKGTYTETDGLITAILTHGDINADDPTDQLQPYDTIDPNDLADKDMPPNKPMSLQISGDSIAWGPITMIRDKYADKFTSSVFNGMITHDDDDLPAKLTVGTDKIWTMSVQTGPEQYTDFIKGVYMMTGTVSAKVFITHGNLDLIDPPNPVAPPDWEYVDEDMSALAKAEFLPSEGQTLTATGITDTSYKMSIYGTLRTFTRD